MKSIEPIIARYAKGYNELKAKGECTVCSNEITRYCKSLAEDNFQGKMIIKKEFRATLAGTTGEGLIKLNLIHTDDYPYQNFVFYVTVYYKDFYMNEYEELRFKRMDYEKANEYINKYFSGNVNIEIGYKHFSFNELENILPKETYYKTFRKFLEDNNIKYKETEEYFSIDFSQFVE